MPEFLFTLKKWPGESEKIMKILTSVLIDKKSEW